MVGIWSLGGCKINAQQYTLYTRWKTYERETYRAALRNGWLLECCAHMRDFPYEKIKACKESAQRHMSKDEWEKADPELFMLAKRRYWLTECCKHMPRVSPKKNTTLKWTYEKCLESVNQCKTLPEWKKRFSGAVKSSNRNGWFEEFEAMLETGNQSIPNDKWSRDLCMESARQYNNPYLWQIANPEAYVGAIRNKCLPDCIKHMNNRTRVLMF